jgi:hypothetical protein
MIHYHYSLLTVVLIVLSNLSCNQLEFSNSTGYANLNELMNDNAPLRFVQMLAAEWILAKDKLTFLFESNEKAVQDSNRSNWLILGNWIHVHTGVCVCMHRHSRSLSHSHMGVHVRTHMHTQKKPKCTEQFGQE